MFSAPIRTAVLTRPRSYSPEANALFARMSLQPDRDRKTLINSLIVALKVAGVWAKLDVLYLTAAHDAQAARLNWVSTSYTLVPFSAPTFLTDRHYVGDGAASYLDTGYQPGVSAGSKALQDDNHFGLWVRNNVNGSGIDAGSTNHTINANNSGNLNARNMTGTTDTVGTAGTSVGHSVHSRSAGATYSRYKDGVSLGDVTRTSSAPGAMNLFLCCRNSGSASAFSTRQFAALHLGGGLTAGEVAALRTALNTFLTALGAA